MNIFFFPKDIHWKTWLESLKRQKLWIQAFLGWSERTEALLQGKEFLNPKLFGFNLPFFLKVKDESGKNFEVYASPWRILSGEESKEFTVSSLLKYLWIKNRFWGLCWAQHRRIKYCQIVSLPDFARCLYYKILTCFDIHFSKLGTFYEQDLYFVEEARYSHCGYKRSVGTSV